MWLTFVPVSIVFNPLPLFSEEGAVKIDGTVGAVAASSIVAQEYKGWIGDVFFVLFVDLCFGVWGSAKYRAAPGPSQTRVGASPAVVPASLALYLLV